MTRILALSVILVGVTLSVTAPLFAEELLYSRTSDTEPWTPYVKTLILEALKNQAPSQPHTLTPNQVNMVQTRALTTLREGGALDIFWTMTSREREEGLFVLRIPLLKGMLGQRLVVIRPEARETFLTIATWKDAQRLTYGQGHDWPDADILEHAGLPVMRSTVYHNLMLMLASGRFDGFPLGMHEIWEEVEKRPELNVVVDSHIMFSYLAPVFIFLNPADTELQQKLIAGFDTILQNGTFERVFTTYYQEIINRANLGQRLIFKLENPNMSEETRKALEKYASILLVN